MNEINESLGVIRRYVAELQRVDRPLLERNASQLTQVERMTAMIAIKALRECESNIISEESIEQAAKRISGIVEKMQQMPQLDFGTEVVRRISGAANHVLVRLHLRPGYIQSSEIVSAIQTAFLPAPAPQRPYNLPPGFELPAEQDLAEYTCPISQDYMEDPVRWQITDPKTGKVETSPHAFERACLDTWLKQRNPTCPLTRSFLNGCKIIPDAKLQGQIAEAIRTNRASTKS
jgi:hypothetical protein